MAKFSNDELNKIAEILSPLDKDPVKNETLNPTAKILRKIKGLPEPQFDEDVIEDEVQVDDSYEEEVEIPSQVEEDDDPDLDLDALLKSAEKFNEGGTLTGIEAVEDEVPEDFTHSNYDSNIDKNIEPDEEDEITVNQDEDVFGFGDEKEAEAIEDTNPFKAVSETDTDPFAKLSLDDSTEEDPFGGMDDVPKSSSLDEEDPFGASNLGSETTEEDPFGGMDDVPKSSSLDEEDPFGASNLGSETTEEDPFGGMDDVPKSSSLDEEDPFGTSNLGSETTEEDPFGGMDDVPKSSSLDEEDPFGTSNLGSETTEEDPFGGMDDVPKSSSLDEEDPFGSSVSENENPDLDQFSGLDDIGSGTNKFGSVNQAEDDDPFGTESFGAVADKTDSLGGMDLATTSSEEDPFGSSVSENENPDLDQFSGLDDTGSGANEFGSINQAVDEDPFSTASFNTLDESSNVDAVESETSLDENDPYSDFTPSIASDDEFGTSLGDGIEDGYNPNLTGGSLDRIDDHDEQVSQASGTYDTLDEDLDSLAEEEVEQEELSDEDLATIQQEIVNYPPKLKRAVIDAVTNNKLSKPDERGLIELIKSSQKPEDVASYLTEKLGYEVELFDKSGAYSSRGIPVIATKDIYTREGELKRRQLLKRTALIAAAVLFGIIGLVSSYKYGLRPFQASRHYEEGIEFIKKAGTLKNPTERTRLLADAKSAFTKGEKIEPNSLEYLNKYGMAYMKIGEYDQAFEKLFGVVEPDFGQEANGENEGWTKRQEVPLIQLSSKTPWSNDKLPLGGKIIPENEYMILISSIGKRKVERKIKRAGAYIVSRLEKNIHDNLTYISLGKFHSNIANLFQKPILNGNRSYKNDNLAINYYKEVFTDGEQQDNIDATSGLAKIYYNQQNFAKSVFYYNKIVDKFPTNPIGNGGLISNYIEMWKRDNNPTFVLDHHRKVRNALNIEDDLSLFVLAKLASFYIDITTNDVRVKYNINPEDQVTEMELQDNVEYLLNIAFNKKEVSDDGEVVKGDEYSEGYYQRGRYLLKRGETIQALKQFELAAQYDPAHYLAVLEMAEHNMRVNNYSDSLDLLENAKSRYETYKDYYGNKEEDETLFYGDYGRIYFDKGKIAYLESALVSKEGKISEFPDRKVYPERSLGKLTEDESNRRKNLNTAMVMFEKAEEYKLQNPNLKREMSYYKGWIEYMRSDYEEAINQWSNLSEDDIYTNPNVMLGRANSFYNLNQLNAALGNYIKIKEDFEEKESQIARPSSDESVHQEIYNVLVAVYNNIGAIYEQKGNSSEALKNYWKSIEIARKIDLTTEIPNHNKDYVFKNRKEGNEPLLDDWLSPTIGTVKELLSTKSGKF
jgi:tetratricopeptide (TPR) repeat protein